MLLTKGNAHKKRRKHVLHNKIGQSPTHNTAECRNQRDILLCRALVAYAHILLLSFFFCIIMRFSQILFLSACRCLKRRVANVCLPGGTLGWRMMFRRLDLYPTWTDKSEMMGGMSIGRKRPSFGVEHRRLFFFFSFLSSVSNPQNLYCLSTGFSILLHFVMYITDSG